MSGGALTAIIIGSIPVVWLSGTGIIAGYNDLPYFWKWNTRETTEEQDGQALAAMIWPLICLVMLVVGAGLLVAWVPVKIGKLVRRIKNHIQARRAAYLARFEEYDQEGE
jgi:hypothetical protein